jgi:hypothetical protein
MSQVTNEELVQKAVITAADALATNGKLNDAQANKFIDYVIDETSLKGNARIVRFNNETLNIDKIGVGRRVTVAATEAADPGRRFGVTTSKVSLTPKEIMTPFEIGDTFKEINLEGESVEDHVVRMMSTVLANDMEDLTINGNALGPAQLESELVSGGDDSRYIKDTFLGLNDGWSQLAEGANIVDADGLNIGSTLFSRAIKAMPTKFRRNKANLRWYMSPDLWQNYQEKLATRASALGDSALSGGEEGFGPYGIKAVPVPLWEFEPLIVEHVTLTGTTPVQLANTVITDVVVHASTLSSGPATPYVLDTDYSVDESTGIITRIGGAISSGAVVKVTYRSSPQLILTHANNFIIGIGRDIRIEKDRDIYKRVNQYAITAKIAVQYEELTAIVKVKNIGLGI